MKISLVQAERLTWDEHGIYLGESENGLIRQEISDQLQYDHISEEDILLMDEARSDPSIRPDHRPLTGRLVREAILRAYT